MIINGERVRARSDVMGERPIRRGIQIGPRIRVGGTLGKIGQNLKIGAGKVLKNPIVSGLSTFIPGVGPGIAALSNALGTALDTSGGSVSPLDVLLGAGKGYAAGKLAEAIPGIWKGAGSILGSDQSIGGKINDLTKLIPGVSGLEKYLGGGGGGGGGNDLASLIGTVGTLGLGAANLANAQTLGKQSMDYAKRAVEGREQNFADRLSLRNAGMQGMLNPRIMDISGLLQHSGPYTPSLPGLGKPGTMPTTTVADTARFRT